MKSLRSYVLVGAAIWTLSLLGLWAVAITFHPHVFSFVRVVHGHPNGLMIGAAVTAAVGFVLMRRGLTPLHNLRRNLAGVRSGAARKIEGTYPSEIQPLVTDLNALLAHQEAAVGRAIAKAGDLAHGLKTPLAVLAQEAERAAAAGQPAIAAGITEQIERMRRQIEYHLAHARAAASGATPGARCVVAESAEPLARTMRRLHADRGLTIELRVDPAHAVRCQREDLDEMLGNLLDNACKWAASRVVISSSVPPESVLPPEGGSDRVEVRVEDDGGGLAPELREAVLQRGVRADEAAPGSGLGLAIVRDVADLYGGAIRLEAGGLGGLRARLTLPAAK